MSCKIVSNVMKCIPLVDNDYNSKGIAQYERNLAAITENINKFIASIPR